VTETTKGSEGVPADPHPPAGDGSAKRRLLRSATGMSLVTMFSRVLGLFREQARAYFLGTGAGADAFGIAFMIPNLFRRLVGEGAMTAAFVPVFTRMMDKENREDLWEFANRFFLLLSAILTVITVAGILASGVLVRHVFARGFVEDAAKMELTVSLTRWMFFYLFFISLAALIQGMLNSFGRFVVSAFTPVLLNVAVIGAAFLFGRSMDQPAYAFAVGVLVGGVLQLGFQVPFIWRLGFRLRPTLRIAHKASREVLGLMGYGVFGMGIYQINVAVSNAVASYLGEGAVSSLQYSNRLMELTLGVFIISISTVILPSMARQLSAGRQGEALETLAFAIRMVIFISLPAAVGLILLRYPVIKLLFTFSGGKFDQLSTELTAQAALYHLLGLVPLGLSRVCVGVFYAARDMKTPVKAATGSMLVNLAACLTLPAWLGHGGVALANTLAALFMAVLLVLLIRRRFGSPDRGWRVARGAFRALLAGVLMGLSVWWMSERLLRLNLILSKAELALSLGGVIAVGGAIYFLSAWAMGAAEPRELLALVHRKGKPALDDQVNR
jgi:putative peptidoglycan lipid II flippase